MMKKPNKLKSMFVSALAGITSLGVADQVNAQKKSLEDKVNIFANEAASKEVLVPIEVVGDHQSRAYLGDGIPTISPGEKIQLTGDGGLVTVRDGVDYEVDASSNDGFTVKEIDGDSYLKMHRDADVASFNGWIGTDNDAVRVIAANIGGSSDELEEKLKEKQEKHDQLKEDHSDLTVNYNQLKEDYTQRESEIEDLKRELDETTSYQLGVGGGVAYQSGNFRPEISISNRFEINDNDYVVSLTASPNTQTSSKSSTDTTRTSPPTDTGRPDEKTETEKVRVEEEERTSKDFYIQLGVGRDVAEDIKAKVIGGLKSETTSITQQDTFYSEAPNGTEYGYNQSTPFNTTSTSLIPQVGLGLEYDITDNLSAELNTNYDLTEGSFGDNTSISAGINLYFGGRGK